MIVAPPSDTGAVNAIDAWVSPAVATNAVGALAVVRGVTDTATETAPDPAGFTARNITEYVVPFTKALEVSERSVITTGVVVSVGLNAFHVQPLFVEYS